MAVPASTDSGFQTEVLDASGYSLVDFWAPWCGPCRTQGPILEQYAAQHPDINVRKHNTDDDPQVPGSLGVQSIPTLVVFHGGKPVVGAMGVQSPAALDRLLAEAKRRVDGAA